VQQETVDSDLYQQQLTDILLAQDYQDLTGQVINRIVTLMTSLEQELIVLIETFGKAYSRKQESPETVEEASAESLKGPLREEDGEKQTQDKVDDLLSSLGF
ncbi:MAG: protein phosphatase CheZ, partial [Proteobacteria bacterium]|nr:protein phosphatase CheZ [Pseudomonadota bacterium]